MRVADTVVGRRISVRCFIFRLVSASGDHLAFLTCNNMQKSVHPEIDTNNSVECSESSGQVVFSYLNAGRMGSCLRIELSRKSVGGGGGLDEQNSIF